MGHLRRSIMFSVGGFLLKRAWGRKLVLDVAEDAAKDTLHAAVQPQTLSWALKGAGQALLAPVYFAVGLLAERSSTISRS